MIKKAKNSKTSTEWRETAQRFVAYIDIMGFKDMVLKKSHSEIYEMMKKIEDKKKVNESIQWGVSQEKLVRTTTYSDSIMLYSKDESSESLDYLICTVAGLTLDLLQEGIPFKGGIAFGEMTLDTKRSIFFGQPLIDAYLLSEELAFYGVILHATAEEKLDTFNDKFSFIKNYSCPLKLGISNHITVYPCYLGTTDPDLRKSVDDLFSSIKRFRYKTSGVLRKYIDNTETYLAYIDKNPF